MMDFEPQFSLIGVQQTVSKKAAAKLSAAQVVKELGFRLSASQTFRLICYRAPH